MPTRILLLAGVMLLVAYAHRSAQFQSADDIYQIAARPTQTSTPTSWPDLDKLKNLNPGGAPCGLDGAAPPDTEEAALNRLMNRYHLPDSTFEEIRLQDLVALPHGDVSPEKKIINYPISDNPHNQRSVSVIGYVTEVSVLGHGSRSEPRALQGIKVPRRGVESSNCYTNQLGLCNAQIILTSDPKLPGRKGHDRFVVEVTERSRQLANQRLLVSNIGKDWSIEALRKHLKHHWVRFSGWLFFDANYRERAWVSDPDNEIGLPNTRQTAWEIHPVMGIELMSRRR